MQEHLWFIYKVQFVDISLIDPLMDWEYPKMYQHNCNIYSLSCDTLIYKSTYLSLYCSYPIYRGILPLGYNGYFIINFNWHIQIYAIHIADTRSFPTVYWKSNRYLWFINFNPIQITHKILKMMSGETCSNENSCDGNDADPSSSITVDYPIKVDTLQGGVWKISPYPPPPLPYLLRLLRPRWLQKSLLLPLPNLLRLRRLLKRRGLFLPIRRSRIHCRRINVRAVIPTHQKLLQLTRCKVVCEETWLMIILWHRILLCIF